MGGYQHVCRSGHSQPGFEYGGRTSYLAWVDHSVLPYCQKHRRASPRRASSNILNCCLHSPSCPATHRISCNPSGLCSPSFIVAGGDKAFAVFQYFFPADGALITNYDHLSRTSLLAATGPAKVPPRPRRRRRPQGRSTKGHLSFGPYFACRGSAKTLASREPLTDKLPNRYLRPLPAIDGDKAVDTHSGPQMSRWPFEWRLTQG